MVHFYSGGVVHFYFGANTQDLLVGDSLARSRKTERRHGDVESDLVSVLEAVHQGTGDAVNTNDGTVEPVGLHSLLERRRVEPMKNHGG